ncbi:Sucrase/ferredoxin-like-domain-containing protein [Amylocarpus encephaloides]|uniref:Altered inheritance of mitochondria protein 32 n=1 Tax=Amylocarpus encephaloides TaxID=45428 RepID=A0A9P7YF65_9HELO|nr:Sucrase/ferredoxin-like-domain-containing protein [Amylocarpus encephaloides]
MFSRSISKSRCTSTTVVNYRSLRPYAIRHEPPTFPTIPKCPSPTCDCSATPELPPSLPIDHKAKLNGTMAQYSEQILICTGKDDWLSRIEEENSGDNLAADIKELLGRGGIYSDPYHNVAVTNASFPSSTLKRAEVLNTSAYLLPSFKYIPFLPRIYFNSVQALIKGYVLPNKLNPAHDSLSPIHKDRLIRQSDYARLLHSVQDVTDILILICGHGGRDERCGIIGPVLQSEFKRLLAQQEIDVLQDSMPQSLDKENSKSQGIEQAEHVKNIRKTARVGLISHIGGHKFAGNVIVYLPPQLQSTDGKRHELAGCGIWYGRVEPKHVEGIIQQTIIGGKVIEEFFRGGIRQGGEILRL